MKSLSVFTMILATSAVLHAEPLQITLKSKILAVSDHKTESQEIMKGDRARVQMRVFVAAKSFANQDNAQWMMKKLPTTLGGYIENQDTSSGKVSRFVAEPFTLVVSSIRCTRDTNYEYENCTAEYKHNAGNTVLINSGSAGEHRVSLHIKPVANNYKMRFVTERPIAYQVRTDAPRLTAFNFAGLPQN